MVAISVTFDPGVDEYEYVLSIVDAAYMAEDVEELGDDELEQDEAEIEHVTGGGPVEGFTPQRMRRYVRLLTVDGRRVLRHIAENAPEVQMDEVKAAVGLSGQSYAGAMSTFGHAVRKCKGVKRQPFSRHYGTYYINKEVAVMAVEALDATVA